MKTVKPFIAITLIMLAAGFFTQIAAQNMSNSVIHHRVKFPKGRTSTVLKGQADYAMSYVYLIGAGKDQNMKVHLVSKNSQLTLSLIAPDTETMDKGFGVTDWMGRLPQTGEYKIVVVMNDPEAENVSYSLEIEIK